MTPSVTAVDHDDDRRVVRSAANDLEPVDDAAVLFSFERSGQLDRGNAG